MTVSSHDNVTKSTSVNFKKQQTNNCKKIKCPTKEEPNCIKLKNQKGYNPKEIYIVVLNKCEIDYIKCHEGLEATLVPMKNCDHKSIQGRVTEKTRLKRSSNITRKTSKNKLSKQSRRHRFPFDKYKIDYSALYFGPIRRDNLYKDSEDEEDSVDEPESNTESEEVVNAYKENNKSDGKEVISFKVNTDDSSVDTSDRSAPEDRSNFDDRDNEIDDLRQTETEEEPQLVDLTDFTHEDGKIDGVHIHLPDEVLSASIEIFDRNKEIDAENAKIVDDQMSTEDDEEVRDREKKEQVIVNKPGETSDDSMEQYTSDCPSVCPAREVMVCARCKEGVYRTFLSVCHLRLFNCKHPEEKLELVSHRPCVLSAPFLTGMKTKGRLKDLPDEDEVLKFIRCREKGDTKDPKCKYANIETEVAK